MYFLPLIFSYIQILFIYDLLDVIHECVIFRIDGYLRLLRLMELLLISICYIRVLVTSSQLFLRVIFIIILIESAVLMTYTVFSSINFYPYITLLYTGFISFIAIDRKPHKIIFFYVIYSILKFNHVVMVINPSNQCTYL